MEVWDSIVISGLGLLECVLWVRLMGNIDWEGGGGFMGRILDVNCGVWILF